MTNRYVMVIKSEGGYDSDAFASSLANAHYLDATSEDIGQDRGFIYPNTSAGRVNRSKLKGPVKVEGDVQFPVYIDGTPSMIYYGLGSCISTETGSSTGIFNHVIKQTTVPPHFDMEIGKDLKAHKYKSCVVKTMTFDYDPSETFLASFNVLARKELDSGDLATVTFPDYNIAKRAAAGTEVVTQINDASVNYLESVSIEVDNQFVDDHFALGSRYLPNKYVQGLEVTGNIEAGYNDSARYQEIIDESALKLSLKHTISADNTFEIVLNRIALDTGNLPTEGSDRYMIKTDFTSERTSSSDDIIIVNVKNSQTNAQLTA